ncbi:fluoride efflux transporter FluC [Propionibacterium sp.]|uniref:fluoride efflux transporter FluC n=1 Tax=Propionibacterium sp. TaxID=1977903 RepID=UPI0039ECAAB4
MTWVLIFVAGGVGSWCRFRLDGVISRSWRHSVPIGTLTINMIGSFLLGLLTGHAMTHGGEASVLAVLGTGLMGGFTTFSTANVEVVRLAMSGRRGVALGLQVGMMVIAVLVALLGWTIGAAVG